MKYDCYEINERLSEFIDDVLSAEEKSEFEKHISQCEDCKNEYEIMKCLIVEISRLPRAPLPGSFKDTLRERLMRERTPKRAVFSAHMRTYSSLAAGIVMVLLLRTGYYRHIDATKTAYVDDVPLDTIEETFTADESNVNETVRIDTYDSGQTELTAPTDAVPLSEAPGGNERPRARRKSEQPPSDLYANQSEAAVETADNAAPITAPTVEAVQDSSVNAIGSSIAESRMFGAGMSSMLDFAEEPSAEAAAENVKTSADTDGTASIRSGGSGGGAMLAPVPPASPTPSIAVPEIVPGSVSGSAMTQSHDAQAPIFVNVTVQIDRFDSAASELKAKYGGSASNGKLTLEVGHGDFQDIMNYLAAFNAVVSQDDNASGLTSNICVITAK